MPTQNIIKTQKVRDKASGRTLLVNADQFDPNVHDAISDESSKPTAAEDPGPDPYAPHVSSESTGEAADAPSPRGRRSR